MELNKLAKEIYKANKAKDIDFHVKEKLWYNSTRDHKHGKKY